MGVLERQLSTAQVMMAERYIPPVKRFLPLLFTFERFACALIHCGYIYWMTCNLNNVWLCTQNIRLSAAAAYTRRTILQHI
jgi:hypothetical protein